MHLLHRTDSEEREIFRTSDEFGPVVVLQSGRLRILSFDSHLDQSVMCMSNPSALMLEYLRVMLVVLAFKNPKRVTILGLGGGSLLRALHQLGSILQIDIVELRESVITTAIKYFGIPSDDKTSIHHCSGFQYLTEAGISRTDIIFADMYLDQDMDSFQGSTIFLEYCWKRLSDDGWLVINFLLLPEFEHPYILKLNELFLEVLYFSAGNGNIVMLCGKQSLKKGHVEYRDDLARLESHFDVALACYFDHAVKISL